MPTAMYSSAAAYAAERFAATGRVEIELGQLAPLVLLLHQRATTIELRSHIEDTRGAAFSVEGHAPAVLTHQRTPQREVCLHALVFGQQRVHRLLHAIVREHIARLDVVAELETRLDKAVPLPGGDEQPLADRRLEQSRRLRQRLAGDARQALNVKAIAEAGAVHQRTPRLRRQPFGFVADQIQHVALVLGRSPELPLPL